MAHLHSDSFDHYATAQLSRKWNSTLGAPAIVSGGRFGTQGLQIAGLQGARRGVPLYTNPHFTGGAFNISNFGSGTQLICFGRGTTTQAVLSVEIGGNLSVWRGDRSALITETGGLIRLNSYFFIEIQMLTANSGAYTVHLNGVQVLSAVAVDTQEFSSAGTDTITIGKHEAGGSNGNFIADDVYMFDSEGTFHNTFLGDRTAKWLPPNGAGSAAAWTPIGSANNWENVDDPAASIDDDTTRNESQTLAQQDLHAATDLPASASVVSMVIANVMARKDEAGERHIKQLLRENAVTAEGADISLSDGYVNYQHDFGPNAPDGAPWTPAKVNASEVGYKLQS